MDVGRRVDYAVRSLCCLADLPPGKILSRAEIEKRQDVPFHYLSKIMKDLAAAGFVRSYVGAKGGFGLAKAAKAISIKDVYESVGGPFVPPPPRPPRGRYRCFFSICAQISLRKRVQNLLARHLASVSIADIADVAGLKKRLISRQKQAGPSRKGKLVKRSTLQLHGG